MTTESGAASNVRVEVKVGTPMSMNNVALAPEEAALRAHPAPIARFEGVSIAKDDEAKSPRGLSFALAPGSFHVLTGAPGTGKSAILRIIALFDRPARGRVQIFGRDIASLSRAEAAGLRRGIGVISPDMPLLDHLTVFDNAALVPRLADRRPGDYGPQVEEVLRWVGLGRRADDWPDALSPGERRRLEIARAVTNRPGIILADEPASGLDALSTRRVLRLLGDLAQAGATVLMATRDDELAAASGAPTLQLHDGRLTLIEGAAAQSAP
jgi:cell division transport system ATP-binding protein